MVAARVTFDPRFAFYHRGVPRGAMQAIGTLYRVPRLAAGNTSWNPHDPDPAQRAPGPDTERIAIYNGPARVQPQLGWRARKQNWKTQQVTEAGFGIQLSFKDNTLADAPVNAGVQFPTIVPNDLFKVDSVLVWDGLEVDPELKDFDYIVRTVTPSSNSWVRTIMCDVQTGAVNGA